jgi:hypothetical protein
LLLQREYWVELVEFLRSAMELSRILLVLLDGPTPHAHGEPFVYHQRHRRSRPASTMRRAAIIVAGHQR